ncbi:hypothetical protein [Actinomyces vulturis]|uniref:hypothetical protein n=1 Tax=Actinomyces vulturis TaxID=1857645 RepID=UPI0008321F0F|nr:hypothetical protein [Actinomyces vulturis]
MRHQNPVDWEHYKILRERFGHVGSFAYWNSDTCKVPDCIRADSEEEFLDKNLNEILHADIVFLGKNFGVNEDIQRVIDKNEPHAILEHYKNNCDLENQYGGKYAKKALYPTLKNTCLEGAYMTDLFKFPLEDSSYLAMGIPSKRLNDISESITNKLIDHSINGLSFELRNIIGVKTDPIFVLFGQFPSGIEDKLLDKFPGASVYKISHYARKGYSKDQFKNEVNQLIKQI